MTNTNFRFLSPICFVKALLFASSLFCFQLLHAQPTELFSLSPDIESALTTSQIDFRQKMIDSSFYTTCKAIEIGVFSDFLSGDTLDFTIPDVAGSFRAIKDREGQNESPYWDYFWQGKIENEYPGYFMIMTKDSLIGGFIQTREKFYAILPLGENAGLLAEYNNTKFNEVVCGNDNIPGPPSEYLPCLFQPFECSATIDALVLVTPNATTFFADVGNGNPFISVLFAVIAMETVNWAFANSDIPYKRIRYTVESFTFNFSTNPVSIRDDINNLAIDPAANALRDLRNADIVIMLTDQNYGPSGRVGAIGPNDDQAYAIVETPFMVGPRFTLAHEVGHLFGARHNRSANVPCNPLDPNCPSDDTDICSHGWRFNDGGGNDQRTILALSGATNPGDPGGRLLNFSNPDVQVNGGATGNDDNTNAKAVKNAACEIVDFRDSPIFDVTITHTLSCEEDGNFQAWANVNEGVAPLPGQPPYTYAWNVAESCASIFPNPNEMSVVINFGPCGPTGNVIIINLDVTVTSSDGATATTSRIVEIPTGSCATGGDPQNMAADVSYDNINSLEDYQIFPNPVWDRLTIEIPADKPVSEIQILDLNGKSHLQQNVDGQVSVQLNISHLPDGVYFIQIMEENGLLSKKFIKHQNRK